ncbi:hypothetical protein F4604DRAFT_549069 [Suillus subluteus]|nr:hypothetical protein F4604DRAFT_549069 [Suillus subluteus]
MKSTSLTTIIIAAAAMAGVVIASGDDFPNIQCTAATVGCSKGVKNYNNGNPFGYLCGPDGHPETLFPCSCRETDDPTCCQVLNLGGHMIPQCF